MCLCFTEQTRIFNVTVYNASFNLQDLCLLLLVMIFGLTLLF